MIGGGQLLCPEGQSWYPLMIEIDSDLQLEVLSKHYLGSLDGMPCYAVEVAFSEWLPAGFYWVGLRAILGSLGDAHFELAGRAQQIVEWHNTHQFCGKCGSPTQEHDEDRARVCTACNQAYYPRLSPCVITVITRDEYCLLAHNANFPKHYYSALAGFIEPGETVETALRREVMEEVGVEVGGLKYFGSQPWPFPGQLMLGFHAEFKSGDIVVDGKEIVDAQWWRYDQLPMVPPPQSLSGQLISHFVAWCESNESLYD